MDSVALAESDNSNQWLQPRKPSV